MGKTKTDTKRELSTKSRSVLLGLCSPANPIPFSFFSGGCIKPTLNKTITTLLYTRLHTATPDSAKSKIDTFSQNYKLGKIEKQTVLQ